MVLAVFAVGLAAAGFCFAPIAGRTAEEWAPVLSRWIARAAAGAVADSARRAPTRGHRGRLEPRRRATAIRPIPTNPTRVPSRLRCPHELAGIELLAAPLRGEDVGIVQGHARQDLHRR